MSCNEWKEYALKDLIDIKHGYAFKGKFFSEEETNLILLTPGNFKIGGGFQAKKLKYYSKDGEVPEQYILRENDILVTMTDLSKSGDTLGYPIKVPVLENKILLHNQRLGKVEIKSDKIDKDFLYYLMCSNKYRNEVLASATGTTVKHSAPDRILKFEFGLPSIEEQQKIANILSCLDDKIELNNEMNKTLEEMAQSLFKRWFVDFEFPNEDGEPYKSSGGEMVDSELGMIPKGWEVKKISELIEVKDGTHASPKVSKEGFPLVTSKHIKGDRIAIEDAKIISEKDYLEVNKRSKVDTGDILISMIGTVGLTYFVQEEEINFAIKNIGLFKTSQNKTLSEYFYLYLKSDNMKNYIEARLAGTTQKYISLGELRNIPVVLPNDSIIDKFKKVVGVLLDKRRLNIINNEELMITRDTLLPKLMNGEIMI